MQGKFLQNFSLCNEHRLKSTAQTERCLNQPAAGAKRWNYRCSWLNLKSSTDLSFPDTYWLPQEETLAKPVIYFSYCSEHHTSSSPFHTQKCTKLELSLKETGEIQQQQQNNPKKADINLNNFPKFRIQELRTRQWHPQSTNADIRDTLQLMHQT